MAFELMWENKGIYRKFTGIVTAKEFLGAQDQVYNDPRFDSIKYVINDLKEAQLDTTFNEDMASLALAKSYGGSLSNSKIKFAFVIQDPKLIEIFQFIKKQKLAAKLQIQIFELVEDARDWVNEAS